MDCVGIMFDLIGAELSVLRKRLAIVRNYEGTGAITYGLAQIASSVTTLACIELKPDEMNTLMLGLLNMTPMRFDAVGIPRHIWYFLIHGEHEHQTEERRERERKAEEQRSVDRLREVLGQGVK